MIQIYTDKLIDSLANQLISQNLKQDGELIKHFEIVNFVKELLYINRDLHKNTEYAYYLLKVSDTTKSIDIPATLMNYSEIQDYSARLKSAVGVIEKHAILVDLAENVYLRTSDAQLQFLDSELITISKIINKYFGSVLSIKNHPAIQRLAQTAYLTSKSLKFEYEQEEIYSYSVLLQNNQNFTMPAPADSFDSFIDAQLYAQTLIDKDTTYHIIKKRNTKAESARDALHLAILQQLEGANNE